MSATARAEARRKAILARGSDRLSKLTSSARGENAPAYMADDPPLAPLPNRPGIESFVGESTDLPTPSASRNVSGSQTSRTFSGSTQSSRQASGSHTSASMHPGIADSASDPSTWSEEQQTQFLNALLGGGPRPASANALPRIPPAPEMSMPPADDNPMAALMAQFANANGGMPPGGSMPAFVPSPVAPPKSRSTLQRIIPLLHLLSCWMLLAYFVFWKEPATYESRSHGALSEGQWQRWADLSRSRPEGWGVQNVPFFWGFTTLTLILHSWRVFTKIDAKQPPMLLALALPHLPPLVRAIILNGITYLQIGGILLDDIAGLIVGVGFLVWIAGWFAD